MCPLKKSHKKVTKTDKQKKIAIFISGAFITIVVGLVLLNKLPFIILGFYLAISLLTFGLYAKDKFAAQAGKWRISESTLHLFSLIGGWPGAAIAQSQLRHKSKKPSFRVTYWFTVIINCSFLGWLLTPKGSYELEIIIRNLKNIYLG